MSRSYNPELRLIPPEQLRLVPDWTKKFADHPVQQHLVVVGTTERFCAGPVGGNFQRDDDGVAYVSCRGCGVDLVHQGSLWIANA